MAHSRATRAKARGRYVEDGWSYRQIGAELGVGKTTLQRWARTDRWDELREQELRLYQASREMLLALLDEATESGDPQTVFAAVHAAKLAGVLQLGQADAGPSPKEVAVILLDVLGKHHAIGKVVRSYRKEVIRLFVQEVERLQPRAPEPQ